jgi:hypothetical protein
MDSYRDYPSDFDPSASEPATAEDVTIAIGTDERRMHVRAYNYWVSLLDGRDYPSIEDLEPADLADFAANSVLLDFTCGQENPATPYIGAAIRDECGLSDQIRAISDVPRKSLLFRLTDHYLEIIANRAPVGFEAEFLNQRGVPICYRGILMPFSSDGDTIDFIYGVINWKQAADAPQAQVAAQVEQAPAVLVPDLPVESPIPELAGIADPEPELETELEPQQSADAEVEPDPDTVAALSSLIARPSEDEPKSLLATKQKATSFHQPFSRPVDIAPLAGFSDDEIPVPELDEDAGLADRLCAARETAEAVKSADGRSRVALYGALSLAYDFAIAAQHNPDEYQELLEESGVKAQARAPMTPIVKLVFGIDYDKTRLTEFASALSFAQRQQIGLGGFQKYIETQPGGLKALVAAERQAKRPEPRPDTRLEAAKEELRAAAPIMLDQLDADDEFALLITRRNASGGYEPVAMIDDPSLVERAIRRAR